MCLSKTVFVSTLTLTSVRAAATACVEEELCSGTDAPFAPGALVAKVESCITASPCASTGPDEPVGGAGSASLDDDDEGGIDNALAAGGVRTCTSSMALVSPKASDLRFDPMFRSIPFFARSSLSEVGLRG